MVSNELNSIVMEPILQ